MYCQSYLIFILKFFSLSYNSLKRRKITERLVGKQNVDEPCIASDSVEMVDIDIYHHFEQLCTKFIELVKDRESNWKNEPFEKLCDDETIQSTRQYMGDALDWISATKEKVQSLQDEIARLIESTEKNDINLFKDQIYKMADDMYWIAKGLSFLHKNTARQLDLVTNMANADDLCHNFAKQYRKLKEISDKNTTISVKLPCSHIHTNNIPEVWKELTKSTSICMKLFSEVEEAVLKIGKGIMRHLSAKNAHINHNELPRIHQPDDNTPTNSSTKKVECVNSNTIDTCEPVENDNLNSRMDDKTNNSDGYEQRRTIKRKQKNVINSSPSSYLFNDEYLVATTFYHSKHYPSGNLPPQQTSSLQKSHSNSLPFYCYLPKTTKRSSRSSSPPSPSPPHTYPNLTI